MTIQNLINGEWDRDAASASTVQSEYNALRTAAASLLNVLQGIVEMIDTGAFGSGLRAKDDIRAYVAAVVDSIIAQHAAIDAALAAAPICSTCNGASEIEVEGQIGAPGSGGVLPCPDCAARRPAAAAASPPEDPKPRKHGFHADGREVDPKNCNVCFDAAIAASPVPPPENEQR